MSQIYEFYINHWALISSFCLVAALMLIFELKNSGSNSSSLTPLQTVDKINHNSVCVVDLRDKDSFDNGHIIGAINLPASELENKLGRLQKCKGKDLIIATKEGLVSKDVLGKLKDNGFGEVLKLSGGVRAWSEAGLPLTKNKN